jgi:hypothetical protein
MLRRRGVFVEPATPARCETAGAHCALQRLPGTDLGAVIADLAIRRLEQIAAEVACAQAIVMASWPGDRYGYAVRPEQAPYAVWSDVLHASLDRSHRRINAAGLFDATLIGEVRATVNAMRSRVDQVAATPFLHDTTTRNVIVAPDGTMSGIVDVDDRRFGDPRYPAAPTMAVLLAHGGPEAYVSAWLRHLGLRDDGLFRLYVSIFLLDLMSEHGQSFNGNEMPSTGRDRDALLGAFEVNRRLIPEGC